MPADFLANDFAAIAWAMRRNTAPAPTVLLHFWCKIVLLASEHDGVAVAVAEAYKIQTGGTAIPYCITTADGTVLMDHAVLAEAIARYQEGMPI